MWSGGISNPLSVIEQLTYLLFIKRLDELHTLKEAKAARTGKPIEDPVFTAVQDKRRIVISADVYGQSWVHDWFLRFKGQSLRLPHSPSLVPGEEYIHWHQREVFQGPAG